MSTAKTLLMFVSVVAAFSWSPSAFACSCGSKPSPSAAREAGAVIFTGMVVRVAVDARWTSTPTALLLEHCSERTTADNARAWFCHERVKIAEVQVFDVWSGDVTERVSVTTPFEGSACGSNFQVGDSYLIYAGRRHDGAFTSSLCSRTALLSKASRDLDELGQPTVNYVTRAKDTILENDPRK